MISSAGDVEYPLAYGLKRGSMSCAEQEDGKRCSLECYRRAMSERQHSQERGSSYIHSEIANKSRSGGIVSNSIYSFNPRQNLSSLDGMHGGAAAVRGDA